jgi:tetratricopeptide (TPR) repeat protein
MKKIVVLGLSLIVIAGLVFAKEEEPVTRSDSPKMREAYEYFVLQEKNPTLVLNNEANFLSIKGRYEEAIKKYHEALAITPNETVVLNNLSWTLILAGRSTEALDPLKKSLSLDPKNPSTSFYLGVAYWMLGDPKNAQVYLRMSVTLDPNQPYSHYYLSKTLLNEGNVKDALAEGELAALILDKAKIWNPDVALYLGDLYGRAGMFQKALLQYQKLVDEKDYAYDAHYGLGITYGSFGDYEKAEKHLKMALKLNGDNPMVYYALGKLYSQQEDKLKKALDYAEKALKFEPENGRFLYLVGWIHYRLDDRAQALEYMKKALAADPENATYRYQVKVLEDERQ